MGYLGSRGMHVFVIAYGTAWVSHTFHMQELTLRLTDDLDPFFLYSLTLSEDDFLG